MMEKEELCEIAKDVLAETIAAACNNAISQPEWYGIEQDDIPKVLEFIRQYGETLCKSIDRKYYTVVL